MINRINNTKSLKYIWILMALLLLNCSVDTSVIFSKSQDFNSIVSNHQESIIEIVVEQFLGFSDAIPEGEENDLEQQSTVKKGQLIDIFIIPNTQVTKSAIADSAKKNQSAEIYMYASKHFFKIPSPPPEV